MSYAVKEIVYTLQGEGAQAGRAAVFCRFAGCNLWSGYEADRETAVCSFCDTDFVGTNGPGGGRFQTPANLADAILRAWRSQPVAQTERAVAENATTSVSGTGSEPLHGLAGSTASRDVASAAARPLVVFTGGEPALQLDVPLIVALHDRGFEVAVETNGTIDLPPGIDWVCVSPKAGSTLCVTSGDELKLIYPQPGAEPPLFDRLNFRHFYLQPMDGPDRVRNTRAAVEYCLAHPRWRISLQTHKILGIP